jgi:hypothetical protein
MAKLLTAARRKAVVATLEATTITAIGVALLVIAGVVFH